MMNIICFLWDGISNQKDNCLVCIKIYAKFIITGPVSYTHLDVYKRQYTPFMNA